jgi:hypothetical protein
VRDPNAERDDYADELDDDDSPDGAERDAV